MTPQPFFVDSLAPLTEAAVAHLLGVSGGALPLAWGRYLDADLSHDLDVAAKHGVPLLLIACRSLRVPHPEFGAPDGARDRGLADHWAREAAARGACVLRSVFLDVEMQPNLSEGYWRAWSAAFDGGDAVPAAYMPNRNFWPASWIALGVAVARGARCAGVWVAMYHQPTDGSAVLRDEPWSGHPLGSDAVPYLAHQHTGNAYGKRYDFSSVNPDDMGWIADVLPVSPATLRSPEMPRAESLDPAPITTAAQLAAELSEVP